MYSSQRHILHLDLDTFFVSVERLLNNRLENKPVLIGGKSDRAVVSSCSYEARRFGVHAGMSMRMARQLCSHAIVIQGDMDIYTKYSRLVTDIIADYSPMYEKTSIDEHYIDLSGMDRFFGCFKWSKELRHKIIENCGLPISFGLSLNKTVSKIATGEAKPNGEIEVPYDVVQQFLNPLSIKKIPGIGKKSYQLLRRMGVADIKTLAAIPPDVIQRVMGKNGLEIWKKAHGVDNTPVKPYREQKSIGTERTFETDTTNIEFLNSVLVAMVEKVAFELRKKQKLASVVTVKIRYSNFDTHSQQKRIAYTSLDYKLIETAKELFSKLYKRRMLIRLIGIKLNGLVNGKEQLSLFENTLPMIQLYNEMDVLRKKYGHKIIHRATKWRV